MNFKPVVAALIALGLSMPVLAANETTKPVEKHHAKHHGKNHEKRHGKHHDKHHDNHHEHHGAKAVAPAPHFNERQESVTEVNKASSPVPAFDWTNRFHFSGEVNVDAKYASRGPLGIVPNFLGDEHAYGLNVNNANLFVDVDVNRFVTAHIGIAYVADSVNMFDLGINTFLFESPITDSLRSDRVAVWANGSLGLDEAYITVRDFAESQFYFRAGKMYVDFGHNPNPYPISYSFTQLLTQTRATTAELGWVSCYGLYGSLYVLDGAISSLNIDECDKCPKQEKVKPVVDPAYCEECDDDEECEEECSSCDKEHKKLDSFKGFDVTTSSLNNWGAKAGYCGCYCDFQYNFSASYLKDIRDVDYLAGIQDLVAFRLAHRDDVFFLDRVGFGFDQAAGVSLHADVTWCSWGLSLDYVTVVEDLWRDCFKRDRFTQNRCGDDHNAELSAFDLTGTYNTCLLGYNTGFSLSYQHSYDAALLLPKWRVQGDVGFSIFPNTTLTFEYRYDKAYEADDFNGLARAVSLDSDLTRFSDSNRSVSTAAIRLGVVF